MRVCILTVGSRGDVQPYVALARGLERAGHRTAVCASPAYRSFVESHGVEYACVDTGDPQVLLRSPEGQAIFRSTRNPLALLQGLCRLLEPVLEKGYAQACQVSADADALLVAPGALPIAQALNESRDLPFASAFLQPNHPTREFGCWLFPEVPAWLPFHGRLRRGSYRLTWQMLYRIVRGANDAARRNVLGLGPGVNPFAEMLRERWPTLYGISSSVLPRPADWGPELELTGYWFLDRPSGWRPPSVLEEFLASGPKPICVGFGSMPSADPEQTTQLFARALARAGQRGILLTGWGGLAATELAKGVLAIDAAPHDWLFPRVAAVVHHGGAGTTAAALRAGAPAMVIPFIADQRFWGARVAALGAGLGPVARRGLSPESLATALRELVENPAYRERAASIARALASEDGPARAVAALPF
ncbi:MAG: glycosyltransferase family 1 protein [Deltaproteobacteria bacterium]|nr:glycosyltransferase family 1 protein [Deltaproteobacteria bacterium]